MYIENREEVVEQLTEMLVQFDKDLNGYATYVCACYDEESEIVKLDTVVAGGCFSDGYIEICSDPEYREERPIDYFDTEQDIADVLDIDFDLLVSEILAADDFLCEDDIDIHVVRDYVLSREDYSEKIYQAYCDWIDEHYNDYVENAERIIDNYERELDIRAQQEKEWQKEHDMMIDHFRNLWQKGDVE